MLGIIIKNILGKIHDKTLQEDDEHLSNLPRFQLPIEYVNKTELHTLSPVVANDLELVTSNSPDGKSMYDYLFQPKHDFAKEILPSWGTKYTSNPSFIKDSQTVLTDCGQYVENMKNSDSNSDSNSNYQVNCSRIMEIWKNIKEDPQFMEKNSYMEWEIFNYLNHSSAYLQGMTVINFFSPLTSIIIPIIILIFPFIILKIQGIPIDFVKYTEVLKDIAKNHFIGKTLNSINTLSASNITYMLMSVGFYILQIYQNTNSFLRFYKNIQKVNDELCHLKEYIDYSIESMENFINIQKDKISYKAFCSDIYENKEVLREIKEELEDIYPFKVSLSKLNSMGDMFKCYYSLYSNPDYGRSLQYSMKFEGYINNLLGLYENLYTKRISFATINVDKECDLKDQYYPPHILYESFVKNNCHFDKNMIITGVNASGKTTILKTTTINIIITQQMGCGFYSEFSIHPYTHIHSYLNIPDTSGRDSLFQAEARRCKDIIDIIGSTSPNSRHFCIFDELYSGTNPIEATKSAYAFLVYLSKFKNVNFILTTHYTSICKKIKDVKRIRNYKMDIQQDEDGNIQYTYILKPGVCKIEGAVEILKNMDYPEEILSLIKKYKM